MRTPGSRCGAAPRGCSPGTASGTPWARYPAQTVGKVQQGKLCQQLLPLPPSVSQQGPQHPNGDKRGHFWCETIRGRCGDSGEAQEHALSPGDRGIIAMLKKTALTYHFPQTDTQVPTPRTQGTHLYLDRAVFKHIHSHFLLFLLLFLHCGFHHHSWELLSATELQEDRGSARVALDLHPQDAVARPLISHMLQAVDGRAGEGDVDVSQDEEHEESLHTARNKAAPISPWALAAYRLPSFNQPFSAHRNTRLIWANGSASRQELYCFPVVSISTRKQPRIWQFQHCCVHRRPHHRLWSVTAPLPCPALRNSYKVTVKQSGLIKSLPYSKGSKSSTPLPNAGQSSGLGQ